MTKYHWIIVLLSISYIGSVMSCYKLIRKLYSKGGRWEKLDAGFVDIILVFVPIINSVFYFVWYLIDFEPRKTNGYNKIFKIKKT